MVVSCLYLSVLMRNNEFSSHRAARDITPTSLAISRAAREITPTWFVISRADLDVQACVLKTIFVPSTCMY